LVFLDQLFVKYPKTLMSYQYLNLTGNMSFLN